VDAGYKGRGKDWVEKVLGLSVEVVRRTPKPTPEKVAMKWAEEWSKLTDKYTYAYRPPDSTGCCRSLL